MDSKFMHELGLMDNVLNMVRESAGQSRISRVSRIKLVVGKFSMALTDSLRFAFEVLAQDELFKDAVLEIEEKAIECQCAACAHRFEVDRSYNFICPRCGTNKVDIVSGRELYVDYFEGEENHA
jgi:hydrogenase nickel incorporation protein HypA/HybF